MSDETRRIETWVYLGQHGDGAAKRDVWRDAQGSTRSYKPKRATLAVGYIYSVDVDDEATMYGSPAWTAEQSEDAADLQLLDRNRRERRDAESAERRARSKPAHAQLLADVEGFARRLSAGARSQLAVELDRAVWRAR